MQDADPAPVDTQPEVERLARVYRSYAEDAAVQHQWDGRNPGNRAIFAERQRLVGRMLQSHGLSSLEQRVILEVGCGAGSVLAGLQRWGAQPCNLYGVDLLSHRIERARKRYPEINFQCANAERLDFDAGAFDLVLLFTVFSSILEPAMAANVAGEVHRVLASGGAVLWYDFRYDNPRNPHVRGMGKREIRDLFPDFKVDLRTLTLLPPLARRLGPATSILYPLLSVLPLLRTHYLGVLIKPEQTFDDMIQSRDGT
jgi:SAM-dependent methyltransferase